MWFEFERSNRSVARRIVTQLEFNTFCVLPAFGISRCALQRCAVLLHLNWNEIDLLKKNQNAVSVFQFFCCVRFVVARRRAITQLTWKWTDQKKIGIIMRAKKSPIEIFFRNEVMAKWQVFDSLLHCFWMPITNKLKFISFSLGRFGCLQCEFLSIKSWWNSGDS